ncbi:hypothetical protein Tco_0139826 [Tanacetum coccineum]
MALGVIRAKMIDHMVMGHFKKDWPKLKNGNRGNQRRNGNAPAKVYVVGNAGTNPDSNVVTGESSKAWTSTKVLSCKVSESGSTSEEVLPSFLVRDRYLNLAD